MTDEILDAAKLKYLRTGAHLTMPQFAEAMGLPLRSYEDLEQGRVAFRPIHHNAATWALVQLFKAGAIPNGLPFDVEETIRISAEKIASRNGKPL